MSGFEKIKEELSNKEKLYSSLTNKKITDEEYVVILWNKFEIKKMKGYHNLHLKCDVLLLVHMIEKFRNNTLKIMEVII